LKKNIIFAFLGILIFSSTASAISVQVLRGGTVIAGDPCGCDAAAYAFCQTFDHPTNSQTACINSGAGTNEGDDIGAPDYGAGYGATGDGMRINDDDMGQDFTQAIIMGGTIWMHLRCPQESYSVDEYLLIIMDGDSTDGIYLQFRTSGVLRGQFRINGTTNTFATTGTVTFNNSGAHDVIAVSWRGGTSNNPDFAIFVDSAWETSDEFDGTPGYDDFADSPNNFIIGDNNWGSAHTDVYHIDDVIYIEGWQAANPWS